MPAILFDVLLVAALIFFTLRGAKKGFVLTLCSLVAVLVAIIGANLLADALAPKVAEAIQPTIQQSIQETLDQQVASQTAGAQEALAALREKGGLYLWAADALESTLDGGLTDTITHVATVAATTVAAQLARGLIFLVGFVVVLILWWILSHALDLVAKLPVLHTLNDGLGGVIGFVKGLIIAYVAVWALYSLTGYVSAETMEQTYLFRFLALHSPMELLMMKDLPQLPGLS